MGLHHIKVNKGCVASREITPRLPHMSLTLCPLLTQSGHKVNVKVIAKVRAG